MRENTVDRKSFGSVATNLLDLVKGSIESSTAVHVLPPGSYLFYLDATFLVAFNLLTLGSSETSDTHRGHHIKVVPLQ